MLDKIKGELVISCQALPGEPLEGAYIMGRMALAAKQAGAKGIRAQGVEDILEIMSVTQLPVIGIIKKNYDDSDVFITATMAEVEALLNTGCEMIALDATKRVRPHNEQTVDLVNRIHEAGILAMADCSTLEECLEAQKIGFDCVSTTMAGYTAYSENVDGPNYALIAQALALLDVPLIAEGKIHYPEHLRKVMDLGVHSAVVGGAITRPLEIATRFIHEMKKENN